MQNTYTTLKDGSKYVAVILRNVTNEWISVKKGITIAKMVAANAIPPAEFMAKKDIWEKKSTLSEDKWHNLFFEKLDLKGLEKWPRETAEKACSLLAEYHDIFSLVSNELGHTKLAEH